MDEKIDCRLFNPRSSKFKKALEETFQKFEAMSDDELSAEIAKHSPESKDKIGPLKGIWAQIADQVFSQSLRGEIYTCIGKGGEYELLGVAKTAGVIRLSGRLPDGLAVYRDVSDGALYLRELDDFERRMERV